MTQPNQQTKQRQLPTTDPAPPDRVGSSGRKIEVWPDRVCPHCNRKVETVRWEESTANTHSAEETRQPYTGAKPCCIVCGTRTTTETQKEHRPEEWKQPFLNIFHEANGISVSHPVVEKLLNKYEHHPRDFLWASVSKLTRINGIGGVIGKDINVTRKVLYPDHTPPVNGCICEQRRQKLVDVDPNELAEDLIVGAISLEDLPDSPSTQQQNVLHQTATSLNNMDRNEYYPAKTEQTINDIISKIGDGIE